MVALTSQIASAWSKKALNELQPIPGALPTPVFTQLGFGMLIRECELL